MMLSQFGGQDMFLWATRVCTGNMPQPSSGPSKRHRIQTKATDQRIFTAMFSSSTHSTTRCEQVPLQPVEVPPTLPTVRCEEHYVNDEQSSLSSAATAYDDDVGSGATHYQRGGGAVCVLHTV